MVQLKIVIAKGILGLKAAVEAISEITDKAMVVIKEEGLSFQVSDKQGQLCAELRLCRKGCAEYSLSNGQFSNHLRISLAEFGQFLSKATDHDALCILSNPLQRRKSLFLRLHNPSGAWSSPIIPESSGEGDPIAKPDVGNSANSLVQASTTNNTGGDRDFELEAIEDDVVDESRYSRTIIMASGTFNHNILYTLPRRDNTTTPIGFTIAGGHLVCKIPQGNGLFSFHTLKQENGDFEIQTQGGDAHTHNDGIELTFPAENVLRFGDATTNFSERVLIHARPGLKPLLNFPFRDGFGNLFFFGN